MKGTLKRGEKGIRILAPAPYKIKEEQEKLDPVTGEIMLDKNGMPVTEEVEIKIPAFRVVPVFDVSQTEGRICRILKSMSFRAAWRIMRTLCRHLRRFLRFLLPMKI